MRTGQNSSVWTHYLEERAQRRELLVEPFPPRPSKRFPESRVRVGRCKKSEARLSYGTTFPQTELRLLRGRFSMTRVSLYVDRLFFFF